MRYAGFMVTVNRQAIRSILWRIVKRLELLYSEYTKQFNARNLSYNLLIFEYLVLYLVQITDLCIQVFDSIIFKWKQHETLINQ